MAIKILPDENCVGQVNAMFEELDYIGYVELFEIDQKIIAIGIVVDHAHMIADFGHKIVADAYARQKCLVYIGCHMFIPL